MANSLGYTVSEDEDYYELDEKTMTDLHLGNAINLDHVEKLATKEFSEYEIYIPEVQRSLWNELIGVSRTFSSQEVGLLNISQRIYTHPSPKVLIRQSVYKSLVDIIGRSLELRDINIPLRYAYKDIIEHNVNVSSMYIEAFRFILKLVCMVSEASREGTRSRYDGILIHGRCVSGGFSWMGIKIEVYANNSFCVVNDMEFRRTYFGSFDSLLLMMDTLGQRICLDIGFQIARIGNMVGVPSEIIMNNIISVGDAVLLRYSNVGYEFIAMFEALVVSVILKKNPDPVTNSVEFFQNCLQEVQEMVEEGMFDQEIIEMYNALSRYLEDLSNESLSNIFCVYRIWGHPRVNIKQGMDKVFTKGTAIKKNPDQMSRIALLQFRKMFLSEYFSKNHFYPPCAFYGDQTYIRECIEANVPFSADSPTYCFWDFEKLEITKMWELPETYDVCHILNDKSVSPTRSELYGSIKSGKGTVMGVQRRGIIRWLMSNSIRCKEFLDKVDREGLDLDSLIIGMYEKEREIKIKARMFSLMSEQMRMYFVLTEGMIAEYILKYFPQITMKDPLHIMIKKLWTISGISHSTCLDPVINIDFEKWNLNMRDELTKPLFQQMDAMFGYGRLISRTHEIFYESYIYSSSGKYLPKIGQETLLTDIPMAYTHHRGGFEGLRQKGWTVLTVALLCYIADALRVRINLLGQGDNQVIRIYMPHSYWENMRFLYEDRVSYAQETLKYFIESMDAYFCEAGLPIKVRETWRSTRLYMYGKSMYLDGDSLPQWTKKLLRSYALTNEGTLTISGVIGTIATNLCASAHASEKPDIMYVVYLILGEWSLEFLFAYHPFTRETIREGTEIKFSIPTRYRRQFYTCRRINTRRLIATILLIPTAVGGSVTIPLLGFIVRGFPDNASEGYCWLKLLMSVGSEFQRMFLNWYTFLVNESTEYDMLVQSPWSLNHMKPPTPGLQSRDVVRDWLLSGTFKENTFLKNMKESIHGFERKDVCDLLMGRKINPLILHEIYNSFPQSYLDQVLRRIENTRTIIKFAMNLSLRQPVVKKLMDIEHGFLGYLYWRGFKTGNNYSECATEQCRRARDEGWGVTIRGLTTPYPLEFLFDKVCENGKDECDGSDFVYARIDNRGEFPPYLGSNVKTKVVSLQDIALRAEPLVCTSAKLCRYAEWLNLGVNAVELIKKNIQVVCNVELFKLGEELDETFYSGSVEHRFNPSTASEGCFINYAPQIGKRVYMSSDNMPIYGRGQTNFTLHFQAVYSFLQYEAAYSVGTNYKHYHVKCQKCVIPAEDDVDDIQDFSNVINTLYTPEKINILRETLGYLDKKVINFEQRLENKPNPLEIVLPESVRPDYVREGIQILLAYRAAAMIMYTPRDIPDMVGTDDLQSFPRIYGYKVSSERVLNLTVEMLITIKMNRMKEFNHMVTMNWVKTKLHQFLLKVTLDKYKGIGSLCIGRTWNPANGEECPQLNVGEYPEDSISFLGSVRANIIDKVSKFLDYTKMIPKSQIPCLGVKDIEYKCILLMNLMKSENCEACRSMFFKREEYDYIELDCPSRHLSKVKKRTKAIYIPLDSAVKLVSVMPKSVSPEPIEGYSNDDLELSEGISMETYRFIPEEEKREIKYAVEMGREKMSILLPTVAIYKWDVVFSLIAGYTYDYVIVFGDGTGFTSLVAARRNTNSTILPTAYLEKRKLIPQDLDSLKPFASRHYNNVSGDLLEKVTDDIGDNEWSFQFYNYLNRLKGEILIISDLEGILGNINLVTNIEAVIECTKLKIDRIHKVYFPENPVFEGCPYKFTNYFCNGHYLEGFISNLDLVYKKMEIPEVYSGDNWSKWTTSLEFERSVNTRELHYNEALASSHRIAQHVFNRNLIPMTDNDLLVQTDALLYRLLIYVSGNFKAPHRGYRISDNRLMLDGILIKVIKGMKMVFISLFGPDVMNMSYFRNLHIVMPNRPNRIKSLKNIQVVLVEGPEEQLLSKKEIRSAMIIRKKRISYGLEQHSIPDTLAELYACYIIPGKDSWNKIKFLYM